MSVDDYIALIESVLARLPIFEDKYWPLVEGFG